MPKPEIIPHGRYFLRSASRPDIRINPGVRFPSHSRMLRADPKKGGGKRSPTFLARKAHLKKKERTQQMEEGTMAEESNQEYSVALKKMHDEAQKLRQQLYEMTKEKTSLEKLLREKELKVLEQRHQLKLFKGHLDLIASTLEEDDQGKHLIMNLLKEIPE